MAMNLRKKIPRESILWVNDVDEAAADRFIQEHSHMGPIKFVKTAKEIAENAVRSSVNSNSRIPSLPSFLTGITFKMYSTILRLEFLPLEKGKETNCSSNVVQSNQRSPARLVQKLNSLEWEHMSTPLFR